MDFTDEVSVLLAIGVWIRYVLIVLGALVLAGEAWRFLRIGPRAWFHSFLDADPEVWRLFGMLAVLGLGALAVGASVLF